MKEMEKGSGKKKNNLFLSFSLGSSYVLGQADECWYIFQNLSCNCAFTYNKTNLIHCYIALCCLKPDSSVTYSLDCFVKPHT